MDTIKKNLLTFFSLILFSGISVFCMEKNDDVDKFLELMKPWKDNKDKAYENMKKAAVMNIPLECFDDTALLIATFDQASQIVTLYGKNNETESLGYEYFIKFLEASSQKNLKFQTKLREFDEAMAGSEIQRRNKPSMFSHCIVS